MYIDDEDITEQYWRNYLHELAYEIDYKITGNLPQIIFKPVIDEDMKAGDEIIQKVIKNLQYKKWEEESYFVKAHLLSKSNPAEHLLESMRFSFIPIDWED